MPIDLDVANHLAQQLMHEVNRIQADADANNGEWISALMQLTASFVVQADPMSTRAIMDVFGLYVERAQHVRLSQQPNPYPIPARRRPGGQSMPSGERIHPDFIRLHDTALGPRVRVYAHDYGETVVMYLAGSDAKPDTARWSRTSREWISTAPAYADEILRHYHLA